MFPFDPTEKTKGFVMFSGGSKENIGKKRVKVEKCFCWKLYCQKIYYIPPKMLGLININRIVSGLFAAEE